MSWNPNTGFRLRFLQLTCVILQHTVSSIRRKIARIFKGHSTIPDGDAELVPDLDGELQAPGPHRLEDLLQHTLNSCARPYGAVHGMHYKYRYYIRSVYMSSVVVPNLNPH